MQRRSSSIMDDQFRQPSFALDSPRSAVSINSDTDHIVFPLDDIQSSINRVISPRSTLGKVATVYTNDLRQRRRILSWPQKIFRWLYSFSLIIFIVLFLAFVSVTPLDVIAQTFDTNNSIAVKTFIVIVVCVVFIVLSLVFYFSRLFQYRVSMNDIPNKSLYIPNEGDYSEDVFKEIDEKLRKCIVEIRNQAAPLANKDIVINHPGVSPPDYIQRHNQQLGSNGSLLPPNIQYEDIIRSLGDKFYIGKILTEDDLPIHLSLREIMLYLAESFLEYTNEKSIPNLSKLTKLYEKFRFGPDLIHEQDLFEFMIEFDKFGTMCQNDYQNKLPKNQSRRFSRFSHRPSTTTFEELQPGYLSNWDYSSGIFYDSSFEIPEENLPQFQHRMVENKYFKNLEESSDASEFSITGSIKRTVSRKNSASSTKSVIRNRLALASRHTLSSIRRNPASEMQSLRREISGYLTDSEFEDENPKMNFYAFRKRNSTVIAPDEIPLQDLTISNDEIKNIEFKPQRSL